MELDPTRRCAICSHYYDKRTPHAKRTQLPLHEHPGIGLVCDLCESEFFDPHWPQIDRQGRWQRDDDWWRGFGYTALRTRASLRPPQAG